MFSLRNKKKYIFELYSIPLLSEALHDVQSTLIQVGSAFHVCRAGFGILYCQTCNESNSQEYDPGPRKMHQYENIPQHAS